MNPYKRHRFPPDIISCAVWLYYRFNLSHRRNAGPLIEDLLAERGIIVSRGAIQIDETGSAVSGRSISCLELVQPG